MAKRRRRKSQKNDYPGWLWMVFGLAIGLSVALAIYVNDRPQLAQKVAQVPQPASMRAASETAVDNNGEVAAEDETEPRFAFYDMLPKFEVVIPEQEPDVSADIEPKAIEQPGTYVLQAGSFSAYNDADRRRAQLALHGIESRIQRVSIDDKTYHRVRIGPTRDLEKLNLLRSRLRAASIDVLRIRLGD